MAEPEKMEDAEDVDVVEYAIDGNGQQGSEHNPVRLCVVRESSAGTFASLNLIYLLYIKLKMHSAGGAGTAYQVHGHLCVASGAGPCQVRSFACYPCRDKAPQQLMPQQNRYIVAHKHTFAGKTLLELGAGTGKDHH